VILIASGSEVQLIMSAREALGRHGIDARVVSMPSWELFREQPQEYRDQVLLPDVKARLAVEAAVPMGWHEWVGDGGDIIGITRFGASAPATENFKRFGFTVDHVAARAGALVRR
jgi:transketolase